MSKKRPYQLNIKLSKEERKFLGLRYSYMRLDLPFETITEFARYCLSDKVRVIPAEDMKEIERELYDLRVLKEKNERLISGMRKSCFYGLIVSVAAIIISFFL